MSTAHSLEYDERDIEKHRIVREMFVDTADDNYVAARWCYSEYLFIDFHWLAVHTLEKYFKAVLMLNGKSAKNFRHDVTKLFPVVQCLVGDLLPKMLCKPKQIESDDWYEETPAAYLKRLFRFGNADNRYMLFGYNQFYEDLYKLDRMVFSVRRLCDALDKYYLPRHAREMLGKRKAKDIVFTRREFLARNPDYWEKVAGGKLAEAINGSRGKRLQYTTLNHNIPFAPENYRHGRLRTPSASYNPVLLRHVLDPLSGKYSPKAKRIAADICDWVVQNIQLPKDVVDELIAAKNAQSSVKSN